ncbi:hypothetical protein GCM10023152_08510 [Agromyces bauzanensis]
MKSPGVLLAAKPTGNLDDGTRGEIMDLLGGLRRDHGLTIGNVGGNRKLPAGNYAPYAASTRSAMRVTHGCGRPARTGGRCVAPG